MLIGLREALEYGNSHRIAIPAINVPYLEGLLGAMRAAERAGVPMILQHAQVQDDVIALDDIGPVMVALVERSENPFVLHVDHAEDADYIARGFEIWFNSAMFDGSMLPFEENVARTREVVALANERGFGIEGELGVMMGREGGGGPARDEADESLYTDPVQAKEFVERTGVTALAASFGTVHGMYAREPKLNYELIAELTAQTGIPIVMHGGSGLNREQYHACIAGGVRKINYFTYAAKAAAEAALAEAAKAKTPLFPDMAHAAELAVRADVGAFIDILTSGK